MAASQTSERGKRAGQGQQGQRPQARGQQRSERSQEGQQEQENGSQHGGQQQGDNGSRQRSQTLNVAKIAMRSVGQMYDMQLGAARMLMKTQARAAVAFGLPDYSHAFEVADERARHMFYTGTDQMLTTAERAGETLSEVQHQVARLVESQTVSAGETWQRGMEELGSQTEESLVQLSETVREEADEALRATESLMETANQSIEESGEQMRHRLEEGAQRGRKAMNTGNGHGGAEEQEAGQEGEEGCEEVTEEEGEPAKGESGGRSRPASRRGR